MFAKPQPAFVTVLRSSSRYAASVETKCSLHGSLLFTLNFCLPCPANSLSGILDDVACGSCAPAMNSRNGYVATAIRSRGAVGNLTEGPPDWFAALTIAPAASRSRVIDNADTTAACCKKLLREKE